MLFDNFRWFRLEDISLKEILNLTLRLLKADSDGFKVEFLIHLITYIFLMF